MTSKLKNVYIDKFIKMIYLVNTIIHVTEQLKWSLLKSSTYIEFNVEKNDKGPKSEVDDYLRISKYKNISTKVYTPNLSEEVFVINKLKLLCHGHM